MGYILKLMTDKRIREISSGEVKNYGNFNYKFKDPRPVEDGLFCAKIFGPMYDYKCNCGIVRMPSSSDVKCKECGVDHVKSSERANRFGHIELRCYYINPISQQLIGSILGVGPKAMKAFCEGSYPLKLVETQYGPLITENGTRYSVEPDPEGYITSAHLLVQTMKELRVDGNISMMENKSPFSANYFKAGYSLYDLFNSCMIVKPPVSRNIKIVGDRVSVDEINAIYARLIREAIRISSVSSEDESVIPIDVKNEIIGMEAKIVQKLVNMLYVNGGNYGMIEIPPIIEGLKGKAGIVRGNLLGKRVDFSGRSVITSGPELPIDSVGLPIDMIHELVKPIIIRELFPVIKEEFSCGTGRAIKIAVREVDKKTERTLLMAEKISKSIKVLMNRAPSLHRYSAMTFNVQHHYGKCIHVPPIACSPFNADFDGDTVAIHLILTDEAYAETKLTDFTYNLMSSANFETTNAAPSHEGVVGAYLLSVKE